MTKSMKEVKVIEEVIIFPVRTAIPVLGMQPRQLEDFNKLFLSELREAASIELGATIKIPEDTFDRLKAIVSKVLSGKIDNEPLKWQMRTLAQTSGLSNTTWGNFKVALERLLTTFQNMPEVESALSEIIGTVSERSYAQDRLCVKAIFSKALEEMRREAAAK